MGVEEKAHGGDTQDGNNMRGRFCAREGDHNYCLCKGLTQYGYRDIFYHVLGGGNVRDFNGAGVHASVDPFSVAHGYGSDTCLTLEVTLTVAITLTLATHIEAM